MDELIDHFITSVQEAANAREPHSPRALAEKLRIARFAGFPGDGRKSWGISRGIALWWLRLSGSRVPPEVVDEMAHALLCHAAHHLWSVADKRWREIPTIMLVPDPESETPEKL